MYINDVLHKTPLITYASYHKENKKTYRDSLFVVDNWRYLEEDMYICPTLFVVNGRKQKTYRIEGMVADQIDRYFKGKKLCGNNKTKVNGLSSVKHQKTVH